MKNFNLKHLFVITLLTSSLTLKASPDTLVEVLDMDLNTQKVTNSSEIEVDDFPIGVKEYKLNQYTVVPCLVGNCIASSNTETEQERSVAQEKVPENIQIKEQDTPIFIVDESSQDEDDATEDLISLCHHEAFLKEYNNLFSIGKSIDLAGDVSDVIDVNLEQLTDEVAKNEHNKVSHEQLISELFAKLEAGTLSSEAKAEILAMLKALEASDGDLAQINLDIDTANIPKEIATDLKIINQLKIDALLGGMKPDTMASLFVMEHLLEEEGKNPNTLQSPEIKALMRTHQARLATITSPIERTSDKAEESKVTQHEELQDDAEKAELATTLAYLQQIAQGQDEIQKTIKDPKAEEKQVKREGFFKNIYTAAKEKFIKASQYTKEKFAILKDYSKEKFAKAKDYSKEKYEKAKALSKEKLGKLSEKTAPVFQKTKQKARELYEKTKETVALMINSGKKKISSFKANRNEKTDLQSALEKPAVFKSKKEAQIHALTSPEKMAYYVNGSKVYSVDQDAKVKKILRPVLTVQTTVKEKQADFIMKKVTNEEAKTIYADLKSYKKTLDEKYKNDPTNPDYLIELHRLNQYYSLAMDSLKTAKKAEKK